MTNEDIDREFDQYREQRRLDARHSLDQLLDRLVTQGLDHDEETEHLVDATAMAQGLSHDAARLHYAAGIKRIEAQLLLHTLLDIMEATGAERRICALELAGRVLDLYADTVIGVGYSREQAVLDAGRHLSSSECGPGEEPLFLGSPASWFQFRVHGPPRAATPHEHSEVAELFSDELDETRTDWSSARTETCEPPCHA